MLLYLRAIPANVDKVSMIGLFGQGIFTKVLNITHSTSTELIVCDVKIEISVESTLPALLPWLPTNSFYLGSKSIQVQEALSILFGSFAVNEIHLQ